MPEQLFLGRGGMGVDPNSMTAQDIRNLADRQVGGTPQPSPEEAQQAFAGLSKLLSGIPGFERLAAGLQREGSVPATEVEASPPPPKQPASTMGLPPSRIAAMGQNYDAGTESQAEQNLGAAFGGGTDTGRQMQSFTDRTTDKMIAEAKKKKTSAKGSPSSLDVASEIQKKIADLRKQVDQIDKSGTGNTGAKNALESVIQNLMGKLTDLQNQGVGEL